VVRGIGLLNDINEIKNIIVEDNNGIPVLVRDVADVEISNVPRLGEVGRTDAIDSAGHRKLRDNPDAVEGIVLMRKGENPDVVIRGLKRNWKNSTAVSCRPTLNSSRFTTAKT